MRQSKKLELVSPIDDAERSGIVVVRAPQGTDATAVYKKFAEADGMLVSGEQPHDFRVCVHFFNTAAEFEALDERLEAYC